MLKSEIFLISIEKLGWDFLQQAKLGLVIRSFPYQLVRDIYLENCKYFSVQFLSSEQGIFSMHLFCKNITLYGCLIIFY